MTAVAGASLANLPERARAQQPSPDEVEAAYLYNFGKFVRWPQGGHGPLLICVAGGDNFEQAMAQLVAGEKIDNRSLRVRPVSRPEEVSDCSMLFLGVQAQPRLSRYLADSRGKPILTVGDAPDFLTRGGMIQFLQIGDHVRFAVNLDAANRSGLGLSSELLKVAVRVTGNSGTGGAE